MSKTPKVKKLNMIVTRNDFESVLTNLMRLGCIDVCTTDGRLEDPEIASMVSSETFDLERFGANADRLVLLGTRETLMLIAWLSTKHEQSVEALLSEYACSWEIEGLSITDSIYAPVILSFPWFFGKQRLKDRRLFAPLTGREPVPELDSARLSPEDDRSMEETTEHERD